jgi:hypothetical protein
MPSHTVPAADAGLPSDKVDEVLQLASKVQWLWDRGEQLEENETDARRSRSYYSNYYKVAGHEVFDQRRILRDAISMTRATSLTGAAVQIGELPTRFDELFDTLDVDEPY